MSGLYLLYKYCCDEPNNKVLIFGFTFLSTLVCAQLTFSEIFPFSQLHLKRKRLRETLET